MALPKVVQYLIIKGVKNLKFDDGVSPNKIKLEGGHTWNWGHKLNVNRRASVFSVIENIGKFFLAERGHSRLA